MYGFLGVQAQSSVKKGRPDIHKWLNMLALNSISSLTPAIAVYVCGPAGLVQSVYAAAALIQKEVSIQIDVHSETFEL